MKGIFNQKLGVVPRNAAKLEKVVRNKKNTTFGTYSRKSGKSIAWIWKKFLHASRRVPKN